MHTVYSISTTVHSVHVRQALFSSSSSLSECSKYKAPHSSEAMFPVRLPVDRWALIIKVMWLPLSLICKVTLLSSSSLQQPSSCDLIAGSGEKFNDVQYIEVDLTTQNIENMLHKIYTDKYCKLGILYALQEPTSFNTLVAINKPCISPFINTNIKVTIFYYFKKVN